MGAGVGVLEGRWKGVGRALASGEDRQITELR